MLEQHGKAQFSLLELYKIMSHVEKKKTDEISAKTPNPSAGMKLNQ